MAQENAAPAQVAAAAPAAASPAAAAAPAAVAQAAAAPAAAAPAAAAAAPALVVVDPKAAREWLKANVEFPEGEFEKIDDARAVELHRVGSKLVEKTKPESAPEKYEDFKAPEGVTLDKVTSDHVKTVAKELGLTQAKAQTLIDKMGPVVAKGDQARLAAYATQRADTWRAASLADPEIGGDKAAENQAVAMRTFDAFGTPALRDVLNKTGFGDNPEILRWAYRIGKQIGPDGKFVGGSNANVNKDAPLETRAVSKLWPDK